MNYPVILAIVLIWLASLAGVGYWQNEAGQTQVRADYLKQDNAELKDAKAKIQELNDAARTAEHRFAQNQADISVILERERQDAKRKTDQLVADYRAGTLRLRDPGRDRLQASGSTCGQAAAAPSGGDGRTPGELSGAAGEFLLSLSGEADEVARQLKSCQQNLLSDRSAR